MTLLGQASNCGACFANRRRLPIRSTGCYRSRLTPSIGNRNQCASLVSLTLGCADESKSMPIVVSLTGSTGTRSKRNFHRPESNWGIPLNSTFRVLIVFLRWLRLRIRAPRQSTDSGPQTRKKCSNLTFQESDFSSCYSFKHLKVEISQKREASFGMLSLSTTVGDARF